MLLEVRTFHPRRGIEVQRWEVESELAAVKKAKHDGCELISFRPAKAAWLRMSRAFPTKSFAQEILALTEAGFSLVETLETLRANDTKAAYRGVVGGLLSKLRSGYGLSAALAAYPEFFPGLFIESVRASEQTGDLPNTLRRYIDYENRLDQVKAHVVAASVYPVLLLAAGLFVVAFMLLYVVPRLAGAYESIQGHAPFLSRLLFSWGGWVNSHPGETLVGLFAASGLSFYWIVRGGFVSLAVQLVQSSPRLWEQLRTYHLARFYRTVGMLLSGGTPLIRALNLSAGILPSHFQEALTLASRKIAAGEALSQSFEASGLTTVVAYRMFRVGERAGNLAEALARVAAFHDERLEQWIKRFMRLFEPALMVLIGTLIGGIVLLMYLPIFQLAGSVH